MKNLCACGYDPVDLVRYSPEWYRGHRAHHLATFGSLLDATTRHNLKVPVRVRLVGRTHRIDGSYFNEEDVEVDQFGDPL